MITVSEIEEVRRELLEIFPEAVRGSVSKSRWGNGRKQLHLSYWIGPDAVGGWIVEPVNGMFGLVEWDTNSGKRFEFAFLDMKSFIGRVKEVFSGVDPMKIEMCVGEPL